MQTVVAVYRTRAEAEEARERIVQYGIAEQRVALSPDMHDSQEAPKTEKAGFWDFLFGSDLPDHHRGWYDSNLREGRTAVSVYLDDASRQDEVQAILHEQGALDAGPPSDGDLARGTADGEQHIPIVKEELEVGKRQREDRYHVRVYTTERPIEESVKLRDERVVIERRPVVDGLAATAIQPAAREFDVIERHEEAVVGKTAHVAEEVVVHKSIGERVETVKENVRETHVDVDPPTSSSHPARPTPR
jgi:hypothetical protein